MSDDNFPAPNWTEWRNRTYVQLWQAVALTFGVEPSRVRKKGTSGKPAYGDIDGLDHRLEIAVSELNRLEWERPNAQPRSVAYHWNLSVSLASFAELADLMGWPLDASIPRPTHRTAQEFEKTIARIDESLSVAKNTLNPGEQASAYPNAPAKNGLKWTPEKMAELRAYRAKHTMPQTAAHFDISEARIRELDPRKKPKQKGYSAFNQGTK